MRYSLYLVAETQRRKLLSVLPASSTLREEDYRLVVETEDGDVLSGLQALLGPGRVEKGDVEAVTLLENELLERKLMISGAESCTSGLVAKLLTDRAGSSSWFWGTACTYANEAKHELLGVDQKILDGAGPVSEACAKAMAEGIRGRSRTFLSYATTGYAGPTGEDVGLVWFGFSKEGSASQAVPLRFPSADRDEIRRLAAVSAVLLARFYLEGNDLIDIVRGWQYS